MNYLRPPAMHPQLKSFIIIQFLDRFHSNLQMFIIRGNDNLSKISGKLERVP